ncbi:hypothetical protein BGW80DRAFT_1335597 [Lactifluus volemus]|nr:hypothetical protein BGW80DRAFT_1335597 [Lactifluus volemus]
MRFGTASLLLVGASLATANPLDVMIATTELSPIRLGYAAAHAQPVVGEDAKPAKMRHLCKNMQKAIQSTASRLLSAIGISGSSLSVTTPILDGSVTRVHITHHKLIQASAIEPTLMIKAGNSQGGIHPDAVVMRHGPHGIENGHLDRPFLQRVHHALMSLGPWEGRIVAFVLGCGIGVLLRMSWVLTVLVMRAFRGAPAPEEMIFVYSEEVAPPYQENDEKKSASVVDVEEGRASI